MFFSQLYKSWWIRLLSQVFLGGDRPNPPLDPSLGTAIPGGCVPVSGMKVHSLVCCLITLNSIGGAPRALALLLLLLVELIRCWAPGANEFIDLRCRAFSLGWVPARIGRWCVDAGRRHAVTRKASLMARSLRRVGALRRQTRAQYSVVEWTWARVAIRNVVAAAPQHEPASRFMSATHDVREHLAKWLEVSVIR